MPVDRIEQRAENREISGYRQGGSHPPYLSPKRHADKTVEQLAEVFRYTLRGSESEWSLLEDEMDFVQAYLEVEQARFGSRLDFRIEVDDSIRSVRIPTMVVQTLVEAEQTDRLGGFRISLPAD